MNAENAREIRDLFDRFDEDGNGKIDLLEFRDLLEALQAKMERAEAEAVFDGIDQDEDGLVDADEFARWWATCDHCKPGQ